MIKHDYFELFQKDSIDKQLILKFDNGVTVTNEDIFSESLELVESLCSEEQLTFGCCEASIFKIQIANVMSACKGLWFNVYITLGDSTDEFPIGRYKVYTDTPTADRVWRKLEAYDAMYDIINTDVAYWYNLILPDDNSTVTMKQFRDSFLQYLGIKYEEVELVNDAMIIEKTVSADELSGNDVITCICEANGCFGHIGRDGVFHYIYLTKYIEGVFPAENLYPSEDLLPNYSRTTSLMRAGTYEAADYSDFTCQCIDRLIIRQEDDDVGTAFGEGDNTYIIEENFLFYGKSEDDLKEISANILDKIEWLNYRPFTATVRGNFCFEAGDSIRLVTRYELIESYALQITFNGIQALRGSFVADGVETYTNDLNSMNSTVVQLKGKTSSLSKAISTKVEKDDIISTINQSAEEIKINANKINFEGSIVLKGYVTVESLTENGTTVIDGSRITTGTIEGVDFKSIDEETKYVDISKGRISGGVNDTECGYIVFGDKHTDSVDSTQHNSLLLNSDFLALSVNGVCVAGSKDSTDFTQCPKELEVKYVKAVNFTNSSVTYGTLKFINGLLVNSE